MDHGERAEPPPGRDRATPAGFKFLSTRPRAHVHQFTISNNVSDDRGRRGAPINNGCYTSSCTSNSLYVEANGNTHTDFFIFGNRILGSTSRAILLNDKDRVRVWHNSVYGSHTGARPYALVIFKDVTDIDLRNNIFHGTLPLTHNRATMRERRLLPLALLCVLLGVGCQGRPPAPPFDDDCAAAVTVADQLVCAHNAVRSRAPGADPPLGDVAWSAALARRARAWADACAFRHSDATDVGENLARGSSLSPAEAVALWASERVLYDASTGECAGSDPASCLHYAAIVSRNVTEIGCGVATCPFDEGRGDIIVCLYSPAPRGTYRGETAY